MLFFRKFINVNIQISSRMKIMSNTRCSTFKTQIWTKPSNWI